MTTTPTQTVEQRAIAQTKAWLEHLVIGLNFCPFAKKEFINDTIAYRTSDCDDLHQALMQLSEECAHLEQHRQTETSLLIFTKGFADFDQFLDLIDLANSLLPTLGYDGTFQIAHFHPDYRFEGAASDCASNFTNRAPFPTLHLLREQSMQHAVANFPNPERIPNDNINRCQQLGSAQLQKLVDSVKLQLSHE